MHCFKTPPCSHLTDFAHSDGMRRVLPTPLSPPELLYVSLAWFLFFISHLMQGLFKSHFSSSHHFLQGGTCSSC